MGLRVPWRAMNETWIRRGRELGERDGESGCNDCSGLGTGYEVLVPNSYMR